jgi:hypothetical protein
VTSEVATMLRLSVNYTGSVCNDTLLNLSAVTAAAAAASHTCSLGDVAIADGVLKTPGWCLSNSTRCRSQASVLSSCTILAHLNTACTHSSSAVFTNVSHSINAIGPAPQHVPNITIASDVSTVQMLQPYTVCELRYAGNITQFLSGSLGNHLISQPSPISKFNH